VLTRLHTRYAKDVLGDDLFFSPAPPIAGGREFLQQDGKLERGAVPAGTNNFQARYAIRHPWTGPIACAHPQRGVWGGPPNASGGLGGIGPGMPMVKPAAKVAFAPRGVLRLDAVVRGAIPAEQVLSSARATPAMAIAQTAPADAGAPAEDAAAAMTDAAAPTDAAAMTLAEAGADASAMLPPPAVVPPSSGGCGGCGASGGVTNVGAMGIGAMALAGAIARRRRRWRVS
jgi:hypothetical protein